MRLFLGRLKHSLRVVQMRLHTWRKSGRGYITVIVLLMAGWTAASYAGQVLRAAEMTRQEATLRAEVAALRERRDALETAVARAEDPAAQETLARATFGFARPGDTVLVIVEPTVTPAQQVAAPPPEAPPSLWQQWWQALTR